MVSPLGRLRSALLGMTVVAAIAVACIALRQIGRGEGLWASSFEVTVGFAETHDVAVGTAVRIRGVNAGQVVAVEYPDHDDKDAVITLRLKLDAKFADRLYGDASASLHATGLLGSKVVAIAPGSPAAGPLTDGRLKATSEADLGTAAAKFGAAADEAERLLKDARSGKGTLGKLVQDDSLFHELKALAKDGRDEVKNVGAFVEDGRATLKSVRQGSDALGRLPLIRSYVAEDATALLIRPKSRRRAFTFNANDLFEPGTAIVSEGGKVHLSAVGGALLDVKDDDADVVVLAVADPNSKTVTPTGALELTRTQAEAVLEAFRVLGVHKTGWFARRKMTPLGLGAAASPVVEAEPLPLNYVQVLLFTPSKP